MGDIISVIIPVYNGAPFIEATIQSVLAQSYKNYEIIVVNDGSTDSTELVLARYADRIKIISIPNGGVSNARNVGILASVGNYIAFLDADDLWDPGKLKCQMEAMKKFKGAGFSFCNYVCKINRSNATGKFFDQLKLSKTMRLDSPTPGVAALRELIGNGNFVGTASNVVIKRDVLDQTGLFDRRFKQSEDLDLWMRCAQVTDFLMISNVLLNKTAHSTNLTNNLTETLQYHELVLLTLQRSDYMAADARMMQLIPNGLATVRYGIANELFNTGAVGSCFKLLFRGLQSEYSVKNIFAFLKHFTKKSTRFFLETLRLRTVR